MTEIAKHFMTQKQVDDVTETIAALIEQDRLTRFKSPSLHITIVDTVATAVIEGWYESGANGHTMHLTEDGETAVTDTRFPNGRRSVQGVSQAKTKQQAAQKLVRALTKKYL